MTSKIDPRDIISDHISTLKDEDSGKYSLWDVFIFLLIPVSTGIAFAFLFDKGFDSTAVGIWVSALSILAGLLINVLVLLYTVKEVGPTATEGEEQRSLIKQVNANLIFAIFIASISICLLCVVPTLDGFYEMAASGIIIALLLNFAFTLLMTLKRLKVLVALRFKLPLKPDDEGVEPPHV